MTKRTIAVIGSRKYKNRAIMEQKMLEYIRDERVISGKCPVENSVDNWAIEFAEKNGWETKEYPPRDDYDRKKFENKFFARNFEVACNANVILAFVPRGQYRSGVRNTIRYFRELEKFNYVIFDEEGKAWNWKWASPKG